MTGNDRSIRFATLCALAAGLGATHCKRSATNDAQTATMNAAQDARATSESPTGAVVVGPVAAGSNACDTTIYEVAPGGEVQDLTQTQTMLLWREPRGIMGYRKPAGPPTLLVALDRPREFVADENYAYVALQGRDRNGLFRVPLAGGTPEFMTAPGGVFNTIDDLAINATHVIMSRNMGEVVRVAKTPPFATQVYSRRNQRRNAFGGWAASDHALWMEYAGRGLSGSTWARLDLESGAVAPIDPPAIRVVAQGSTVFVVRGTRGLTVNANEQRHEVFVANEATGVIEPRAWWSGTWGFGWAADNGKLAFSTIVEAPANAMPIKGWLYGVAGQGPMQRYRSCPPGTSMMRTPLDAIFDGQTIYARVSDNSNRHSIVRVTPQ
ncbi:MAG: hypothetical protein JNK05_22995 [Myxococcales bacterium]|nr:hypothetical protein [Myxococcales bacterium]